MAKKIMRHIRKRRIAYALSVLTAAIGIGFYASFFIWGNARALSGVALVDSDTTGYGLDGRDFSVSWTPGAMPAGYMYTKIFITTGTVQYTTSTIEALIPAAYYSQSTTAAATLPQYLGTDSNGVLWTTSSQYVAWVFVSTTLPSNSLLASSTPVSTTFDNVADTMPPGIDHISVHAAKENSAANIYAFVFDDQTTASQFANPGDGGGEYFKLYYATSTWSDSASSSGSLVAGELFGFVIPSNYVPSAGSSFKYYLKAVDRANNARFFCADPSFSANTSTCQTNPLVAQTVAAGSRTVTGTIRDLSNNTPIVGAFVFAGGWGEAPVVTTSVGGVYSIGGIPNNDAFDFTAIQSGFCKNSRFETIGTVNKQGIDISLSPGSCSFYYGSGGGGGGAPQVVFSGPPDQMMGVQTSEKIRVGFNQPMDSGTINDSNAADAGSKVYLTFDDGTTKIAGAVTYCENNTSPGCSALFSMDQNTILFNPTAPLTTGTFYTLVITEGVKSTSGQTIQGNRAGGGHLIRFTTIGNDYSAGGYTLGSGGQFMPPYVRSMIPGPGMTVAPNIKILLEFNKAMDSASFSGNIILKKTADNSTVGATLSLDSTERRFLTVTPGSSLAAGEYEMRVLGGVKDSSGITMRMTPTDIAFSSRFNVSGSNDLSAPIIYSLVASGTTGVAVNTVFEFGFNEQLSFSTLNTTNITMVRGGTSVSVDVKYDAGKNNLYVAPNSVLAPNTAYSITFGSGVTDLAGNSIVTNTFSYTTGASDSTKPSVKDSRCDDYSCKVFFTEPMNHDSQVDANWVSSTLNHKNLTLTQGGGDKIVTSTSVTYNSVERSVMVENVGLTFGGADYSFTIAGVTDLSGNIITTTVRTGKVESSSQTFGSFGDMGMFAPPTSDFMGGGGIGGGEFKPMGFGSFTVDQFAFGQAAMAFPFNSTASQDANVFQVKFTPGVAVEAGDQVAITFPNGTGLSNAVLDTLSPFYSDFNQFANGTVTGTAIAIDSASNKVTVTLGVLGAVSPNDNLTVDLRKITNPSIPKDPSTSGYTVSIQVLRAGAVLATQTSMPYFIMAGGSRRIHVAVVAGTATNTPTSGANGTVYLFGGGPSGPVNKTLTLTNGSISAVDGSSATVVELPSLNDGCYFFGTDPMVTLGGVDYTGQFAPEPVCVNSGVASTTKYLLLTSATSGGSVTTTIKITGITFSGNDIDIFAGGPGKFVVKTLTGVTTTAASGYNIQLTANGKWFIGVGPAMPKGASGAKPSALPGVPPAPIELDVSGVGTANPVVTRRSSMPLSPGVAFNDNTDIITFTFATADKTVSGTVKDGSGNALSSVEVFMHKQGFGSPAFGTTNASGTFSLSVSDFGTYEIGAWKEGLPPVMKSVEVRADGADVGSDPDIYFDGKQITGSNPLVLSMKKASYSISGKILDSNSNGISGAPVFARDANGNSVFGMSGSDGSYSLFVDAGTWTVRSELPPDKTDTCGTFSKTVTVTTESKSSQNISPSTGTCYTLTGNVSVGSANLTNVPLFIEEWDSANSRPVVGGARRGASTDSSGNYSVKLTAGTYRIGSWHPDYGELSATKTVSADTSQNLSVATTSTVAFTFTGGAASMNALIELQNSTNANKRISKQVSGLASSTSLTTESGATYNYFVDVAGYGKFSGTVASAATATIDVSATNFITVTGTIYQNAATSTIAGTLVTFTNTSTGISQTAVANASGTYSINIKAGSYEVSASVAGYLPTDSDQIVSFTTTTSAYDFGGADPDRGQLSAANRVIEGVVSSSAGAAMTDGYVWATNASGTVVSAAIDSADGSYSLPVTDGTWTVKAVGSNSAETTGISAVTISGSNSTGNNFVLTADSSKAATSTSGSVTASTGGSVNDTSGTGIKLTAGAGVLETGSGNVTLNMEKSYTAPDSENYNTLANATFSISATGNSTIKDLNGNAEIQIDYASLLADLPSDVSEDNLKLMYYSSERDEFVPVEGGYTINSSTNVISGQVNHLTDFVIAYVPPVAAAAVAASAGTIYGTALPAASQPAPATSTLPLLPVTPVSADKSISSMLPSLAQVLVINPSSKVKITNVGPALQQPGSLMAFDYQYKNEGKILTVRVVRELVNSNGKVVAVASTVRKLKTNEVFKAKVKEKINVKLPAGNYTERIRIYNASTKKLLDENGIKITVEKLKKKVFNLGDVFAPESGIGFDAASLASIKSDVVLPANFKLKYSYTNNSGEAQRIRMVREVVDAKGKVLSTKTGKWDLKDGESDSVSFTQSVAGNLAVGSYKIRIRAYDLTTKELLDENSVAFAVGLK